MLTEAQQRIAAEIMRTGKLELSRTSSDDYMVAAAYVLERISDGTYDVSVEVHPARAALEQEGGDG